MALTTLAGTQWKMGGFQYDHPYGWDLAICWNNQSIAKIETDKHYARTFLYGYTIEEGEFGKEVREIEMYNNGWKGSNVIFIAGGPSAEDTEAIDWFEAHGVQVPLYTLQTKEAIPSAEVQEITPDEGFEGLSKVTVQRVENENLIPENIRKDVEIFGVVGTFEHEPDENLIPGNIKKGVEILGVTGTFDGFDPSNPIAQMTNLAGSGQDQFVHDWAQMAKIQLHEQGVSNAFLATDEAQFILAKAVTDLIEDGTLSATTLSLIATLRVNHPHTEDDEEEATQNV